MTEERRLHPLAALRFMRKTLAVYLIPLIHVLYARNWPAFWQALRQDAILFALLCAASWGLLQCGSWQLDAQGALHLRWRLGVHTDTIIRPGSLAAVTIDRPLFLRLAGASRITFYPIGQTRGKTLALCLHRADAELLADALLPIRQPVLHAPSGDERAALALLGANGLSTLALGFLAVQNTRELPLDAETLAFAQLGYAAAFVARWLPVGAAWLLTLAAALLGMSLVRSFAQTVRYQVWHTADQVGSRGGWLDKFECRVQTAQISYADVRVSPVARLLKRWPVFVTAGSCTPELPLFVYRSGGEALFRELLPEFEMPPDVSADITRRSLIFFAPAGIPFALCALLTLVSCTVMPTLTITLLFPTGFFLLLLSSALVGYWREGIWPRGQKLTLRRQKGFYLHCICVFHPDPCVRVTQSPWAVSRERATVSLYFPGRITLKVRSVCWKDTLAILHFMEEDQ